MSPQQGPGQKVIPQNNLYTVILAVACAIAAITTIYVVYMCYTQYGTIMPPH
jgi:hypothetical protein